MPRVAVIGSGGTGKSTFASELGRRLGAEVIHLDRLYWRPGWVPTPPDEWRALQRDLVARPDWIIDGNYGGTLDLRLAAADVVVFFDMPRLVAVAGILTRWLRHYGRDVQASGCREHFDLGFLRWAWRYRRDSRPRVLAALREHAGAAEVVFVRSPREAREAVAKVVSGRDTGLMAGGNVDVVNQAFASWNEGAFEEWKAIHRPDVYVTAPEGFPEAEPAEDRDEWFSQAMRLTDSWEEQRVEVEDLRDVSGERVLTMFRWVTKGKDSGIALETPMASLTTVRDGQIARLEFFLDREEARRAAGLLD